MNRFYPTMGLEVHAQLKTDSKLFCSCATLFTEKPNTNVCPVCMGMPGVMPVINRKCIELAVKAAISLNCRVNLISGFARKNYFYPDLPKGYQITQFRYPIAEGGYIDLKSGKRIRIRRLHIEEDTGKMIHDHDERSLVDFNRAGMPLIEIVTEPDFHDGADVVEYLMKVRQLLRYTGASDANMEMGELRGEPNISLSDEGSGKLGVKTEIKNLNSFRSIERGIISEMERQKKIIESGEEVISETLLYNEKKQEVLPMRKKESASEYRYFIEPDLPDLILSESFIHKIRTEMSELPEEKTERFMKHYNLTESDAVILCAESKMADYFENSIKNINNIKKCSNFFIREIPAILNRGSIDIDEISITADNLNELLKEIECDNINLNAGQEVLFEMIKSGKSPKEIIAEKNLMQTSDEDSIRNIIKSVIDENQNEVNRYKKGEDRLFGFIVGLCMKKAKGSANPSVINKILKELLK